MNRLRIWQSDYILLFQSKEMSMKQLLYLLAGLFFATQVMAAESKFEQGLLWKIESNNTPPSYLFGTIHVDDTDVLAVPAAVTNVFNAAEIFAAEAINDKDSARRFNAAMLFAEPQLPALLGNDNYRLIDDLLAQRNIPEDVRPRFKPWAAMLTLQQPPKRSGLVLDQMLLRVADQHKKTIVSLETIDEQIAAFNGMSQPTQIALLGHVQTNQHKIQNEIKSMIAAYLDRDLARLMALSRVAFPGGKVSATQEQEFLSRILFGRSKVMAERLLPLLKKGNAFAACGALHLYGERGMLSLLEQQGFKITKVY
jgi:uncharacterized protein